MFGTFARGGEGEVSVVGAEVMIGRMKKNVEGYVKCINDSWIFLAYSII